MSDLVMRWTGGWVRDKLLGVQSHDIDVALSSMTGEQFGSALQEFMKSDGDYFSKEATAQGINADFKDLHKIAKNPEKSKHLETITTKMFGIDVDFVNLRKEVYDDTSRNPQIEFGTAEEDASRRDATVNALFYNLDSQTVEDFTGRGLDDMEAKLIRTPLPPYQTFKDDPLRVLRLIRFACRLGYEIEDSAKEAMKDESIHEALKLKISRERVGVEVGKIFAGPDPHTGLTYIIDFNLYSTVFVDPATTQSPDHRIAQAAYNALQVVLDEWSAICIGLRPKQDQSLSWFLAAYVPWSKLGNAAYTASREAIKATKTMSRVLDDAIKARPAIVKAVELVNNDRATRGGIGMTLRASKDFWRQHVLYSLLCDAVEHDLVQTLNEYANLLSYVHDQHLEDIISIDKKIVLKGNEVKDALGVTKAGPWMKNAVDMVVEWQLDQQQLPTKEAAIEMIRSRKEELGLK
jgi:tRNA nucleotidyltransferase (CCA-adding enzyme)